ncbi:hypothetical protein AOLI_G00206350 [Acnodon oligacanthus]
MIFWAVLMTSCCALLSATEQLLYHVEMRTIFHKEHSSRNCHTCFLGNRFIPHTVQQLILYLEAVLASTEHLSSWLMWHHICPVWILPCLGPPVFPPKLDGTPRGSPRQDWCHKEQRQQQRCAS